MYVYRPPGEPFLVFTMDQAKDLQKSLVEVFALAAQVAIPHVAAIYNVQNIHVSQLTIMAVSGCLSGSGREGLSTIHSCYLLLYTIQTLL